MDDNILFRLFDHAWVLLMAVIGYVVRNIYEDVTDLKDSSGACELNLEKFKTQVSEKYCTKEDMVEQIKEFRDDMKEIKSDIKTLIRTVK
jgi:uncharacterized protein YdeI (BOF family)